MGEIPVIVHIPHCSIYIPLYQRDKILLIDTEIRHELLVLTDWYVDELFDFEIGYYHRQINRYSRLVFDPERLPLRRSSKVFSASPATRASF